MYVMFGQSGECHEDLATNVEEVEVFQKISLLLLKIEKMLWNCNYHFQVKTPSYEYNFYFLLGILQARVAR